jgi:hypothetical protein
MWNKICGGACVAVVFGLLSGCGGSSAVASGGASSGTGNNNSGGGTTNPIQGIATPSSVSVVTANNSN